MIDKQRDSDNVYFLNAVTETDLLALAEKDDGKGGTPEAAIPEPEKCGCKTLCEPGAVNTDCPVCKLDLSGCEGKAPEAPPADGEPEAPKPAKENGPGAIVIVVLVALAAGGAGYYFKVLKPKKELDDADDFEDIQFEDDPATGGADALPEPEEYEDDPAAEDMAAGLPSLVEAVAGALPFMAGLETTVNAGRVVDSAKVSDHHAIIPTPSMPGADLAALPAGEKAVLSLIAARLLCAVGEKYVTAETVAALSCGGHTFTAKGRTVTATGWKSIDNAFRATLKEKPEDKEAPPLPDLAEGQELPRVNAAVKEGTTAPPKHYTEDTLLSSMETAGAEDMPEDAERKGLGTPATRAGIIEKLVKTGFVERKAKQLLPTPKGAALIGVLPELIKSPALTAEWEHKLKQVERGELDAADFMAGIAGLSSQLVQDYGKLPEGADLSLFQPVRKAVGTCPRCGGRVVEGKKGFTCENRDCGFALWKENRFFKAKKKELTAKIAAALLKEGRAALPGCHSEKTGKTYDAIVILDDTGGKFVGFKLDFPAGK